MPDKWKIAKIIPLRKPQKDNYTEPESFRSISLLPIISKALESVIDQRLSFFIEEYGLLPDNYFGGKKRCTIDALIILQEKMFQAGEIKKSLVWLHLM